jgi:hypothetical protein
LDDGGQLYAARGFKLVLADIEETVWLRLQLKDTAKLQLSGRQQ